MYRPNRNNYTKDLLGDVEYLVALERYCNDIELINKQLRLGVVSRSNAIDYAEGFELAMDFIDKHPADPDITSEQVIAWIKLQDFLNKSDCKNQRIITD